MGFILTANGSAFETSYSQPDGAGGNDTTWAHRFHTYRRFHTQLAPTSGVSSLTMSRVTSRRSRPPCM